MIKWDFENKHFGLISELVNIVSPSMDERNMALHLRNEWLKQGAEVRSDIMGNVYATVNNDDTIHIGLIAHMDTVFKIPVSNLYYDKEKNGNKKD